MKKNYQTFPGIPAKFPSNLLVKPVNKDPFRRISLDQITRVDGNGKNPVRTNGYDRENRAIIRQAMMDGEYIPEQLRGDLIPAMLQNEDGTYSPLWGMHRLRAWKDFLRMKGTPNDSTDAMFSVMVVEIISKPKKYIRLTDTQYAEMAITYAQLWENEKNFVFFKKESSDTDIIKTIIRKVNDGTISDDEESINEALRCSGIRKLKTKRGKKLVTKILEGIGHDVEWIEQVTEKSGFIQKHHDTYGLPKNVKCVEGEKGGISAPYFKGGTVPPSHTERVADSDYDWRVLGLYSPFYAMVSKDGYDGRPLRMYAEFSTERASLDDIRSYKVHNMLNDMLMYCRTMVRLADEGKLNLEVVPLPQSLAEMQEYERTGKMPKVKEI